MRNDLKDIQVNNNYLLGIDLEGMNENLVDNGINFSTDRVTEIGAVLWDVNRKQPVQIFSFLIDEEDHLPITQEITELTGIDDQMLKSWGLKGKEIKEKLNELSGLFNKADYIVAHNGANYDLPMLDALYKRQGLELPQKTWIDSANDIEYPRIMKMRSLAALEHAHGFINPFPHRAVTDVLSMLKIVAQYPIERIIKLAESPRVRIVAKLDAPNWRNKKEVDAFNIVKNKVAKARFKWNPEEKIWFKDIHKVIVDEGKLKYDFEWKAIDLKV